MKAETLEVMWEVIDRNKGIFVEYLNRKARLLGLEKLAWYDVDAPLGGAAAKISYDEAADFIVEHFGRFSPDMAQFARKAFEDRWIEAEDRPGKRPGGFCTSFPLSRQSRIFMTFAGTASNVGHPGPRAGPRLPSVGDERPAPAGAGICHERRRDGVHLRRAARERCRAACGHRATRSGCRCWPTRPSGPWPSS